MKREINKNDVLKDPHIKWNKFVELIACEGYDDMTKIQRKAHLVFYFEQEMQNGGIAQYFTNQKTDFRQRTISNQQYSIKKKTNAMAQHR